MHLILTGATGLVGSSALHAMLKMRDVTKISILSRRPVPMAEQSQDPRVDVLILNDFTTYSPEVLRKLEGASGAVWALGISQTKASKEDYVTITKDYPLAAAKAFADLTPNNEPFRFIYISTGLATQKPGLFSPYYAGVKGEAELSLSKLRDAYPHLQTETVRAGYVDATQHAAIKPYIPDPGFLYNFMTPLVAPPIRLLAKWMHSPSEPFGQFLVEMAMGKHDGALVAEGHGITTLHGGSRVLENEAFRRIAGLS
ncbi:hypothetical protein BGZ61DRAFT_373486 [Ilyonectria robusta]|uniref:uncharacterized protein n=1 Tax=Ilyonectria robusta TaxID=1079257 RepID=UPI001E8D4853|nr:uncharacterized protein BGZ61DRAFT_373486 [Ilyonectria robusta]KAH8654408.1 hypothetical protein BGZ61DRAFT_373486 [Ilyonectria robusta]